MNNPRFIALLEQARARVRRQGGVKSDAFWAEVGRRRAAKALAVNGKPRVARAIAPRRRAKVKTTA